MINQNEFTTDWLIQVSKKHQNADKILVEKVARALLLVEGLVKQKLDFVFKGGTALMLHLNSTKRLSIDIDIILPRSYDNLDEILDKIANEQGFIRKELQNRTAQSQIKKEHYKFYYSAHHKTKNNEEYVLLDILYEDVNYANVIEIPIESKFVPNMNVGLLVKVPCLEDMLGDKLTAFAPNTTGIPYFKRDDSMSMEIIKQLYDIGNLFDVVEDISIVKSTFMRFANTELIYRNSPELTISNVLDDIYQTSLCIVTRGQDGLGNFNELQMGIGRIERFIFSEKYHLEKAIIHASKAAYISALIKYDITFIEKFRSALDVKDWIIEAPFNNKLNKLKKSSPESFFYWYKIFEFVVKNKM